MAGKFPSSIKALDKLASLLECSICNKLMTNPCSLSTCDHSFCRQCIKDIAICPECELPFWQKDIIYNHQFNCLLQSITTLQQLLINSTPSLHEAIPRHKDKIKRSSDVPSDELKKIKRRRIMPRGQRPVLSILRPIQPVQNPIPPIQNLSPPPIPPIQRPIPVSPQLKENTNTINIIKDDNSEPFKTNNGQPLTDRKLTTPMLKIKRNNLGETPLHSAAIKGDLSQVDRLLNEGADPNVTDNAGWTPLHEACNHGYHDIVKRLISNGALVNIPGYNNDTPLHDAIRNSHYHIVPTLLESGANGSLRNSQGLTPRQLTGNKSLMGLFDTPSPNKDEVLVLNGRTRSDEVVILGSGLKHYQRVQLSNASEELRARVVKEFSNEVTHVITDCDDKECCSRTFKCLAAVCSGNWLLKYQWISDSLENGQWMDECHYMIKGFYYQGESWLTNSPYRARCNSLVKNPGLFDGCHFYFSGSYSPPLPNKESLIELVQLAGGHLLTREPKDLDENDIIFTSFPFHANSEDPIFTTCHSFIIKPVISSPSANSPYLATLPCSWVLDCLAHFQLIDFTKST